MQTIYLFFILGFVLIQNEVQAQPVASFSASTNSGCSPLTNVQFTDQSSGNPTSWLWKKNGVAFSTLPNPTSTFSSAGSYVIQLTATNSQGSSSSSQTITVHAKPTSNFNVTSSTAGCLPLSVSFQDLSIPAGAPIATRVWSFGDGGQSNAVNPVHNYTLSGNFPVSLKVTDNNGCEDTKQIPNYIQVYPLPNASFTSNSIRITCAPPITVLFQNTSGPSGSLSFQWDFGDGITSTLTNPSHTYTTYGEFDVTLTVIDNNACSKSVTYPDFVVIKPIQADFTMTNDSICLGDSVLFVTTSQGAQISNWNFGDNTTSNTKNVWHTYQDSGWYQVRLISSIPIAGCKDTAYKNIYVQRVVADFSVSHPFICQLPQEVLYINNSTNHDYYTWYRGAECPNVPPFQMNCGNGDTTSLYNYDSQNDMIFRDTLVVESILGCRDTMVLDSSVTISTVKVQPVLSQFDGCYPYPISFTGNASPYNPSIVTPNPPINLVSFEWYLNDTLYSTLQHPPPIVVNDTGTWNGGFKAVNSLGCYDSLSFSYMAGDTVVADFQMVHDTICLQDFDSVISLSQDTNYINTYKWFTTTSAQIQTGKIGAIRSLNIGHVTVGHVVSHHGCSDTLIKPNAFYASGPKVAFYPTLFDCTDSTKISFVSYMEDAAYWYWNFGDSTLPIDSVNANPTVNYSKKGVYNVLLTAYNADSSCSFRDDNFIVAGDIKANLLSKTGIKTNNFMDYSYKDTIHGCAPLRVHFTGHNSGGAMLANWDIDGTVYNNVSPDSILSKTFSQRGFYSVTLMVFDTVANCADTHTVIVGVYKPIADFVGNPNQGCTPLSVLLQDSTSTLNSISSYLWTVGPISKITPNFSHTFSTAIEYNARLIVEDNYGCSDTIVKEDYVSSSNYNFDFYATNTTNICAGDSLLFFPSFSTTNIDLTWVFEPADTVKSNAPWHVFPDSGSYDILLIGKDSGGCVKEVLRPDFVNVQSYPVADFVATPTDSTCYPLAVQFYADTNIVYYDSNSYYYVLGDFSAASNYKDPFYNYVRPGSYTITLVVESQHGCIDSITKPNYINIGGPYGELLAEPDSICRGDSVRFTLVNVINLNSYGWDFGDGNSVLNSNPVYHTYLDSIGEVYPTLFFDDSSGGCSKTFVDTIYIFENEAKFSLVDTIGCAPYDPEIKNLSTLSNSFDWQFGDGTSSSLKDPSKIYTTPGRYLIELYVKGLGCSDSSFQYIDVYPVPIAVAESDTLICEGDSIQLFANGGSTYLWTPKQGLNNDVIYNPLAYPSLSIGYEVEVTDTNGCVDIDSVTIIVQNPISIVLTDLVMIVGDTLTLINAYSGQGFKYQWIPSEGLSCDTCPSPVLTALESDTFIVLISDTNGCFETASSFVLDVEKKYSLDVPQAFTPNGDGINDIIYVRGWGIKDLRSFQIFNRWGELVFESSDLSIGWDGTYKGKLQAVETYVYYVEALSYGDEVLKKKGNINLLR